MTSRIRARRLECGLSQVQAAASMGVPQSRWSRIESGRHDLRLSTLARVARVLKCSVGELADGVVLAHPRAVQGIGRRWL